jgi:fibronectin type 3 domain-containing protein
MNDATVVDRTRSFLNKHLGRHFGVPMALLALSAALVSGCGSTGSISPGPTPNPSPTVPAAPTAVTATAGDGQVSVSWTASSGAASYNVYYGTATGVTPASANKVAGVTAASAMVTGLTDGTTYYFIVTAVDSTGESVASSQVSATPLPSLPTAPTAFTATAGNAQVSLTWVAGTGAVTYNLYYGTTAGVTPATGTKVSGLTGTSYTLTGLTNGTMYYFVLTSVNVAGESAASNQASATPLPQLPNAPTALTATAGNAQASLTWAAGIGASTYNLYYGTSAGVTPATGTKVSGLTGTSYTLTGLTNGKTYFFVLTSANVAGESASSNQASATPLPPLPAAPTALAATAANTQVALTWMAGIGASTYNLYYGTSAGVTPATGTKVAGLTGISYTLTGLTNGTTYFFVLTSVNIAGESGASNQVSATPLPLPPEAPTALTAAAGNSQVALTWMAGIGASTYNLYYGTSAGVTPATGTKIPGLSGTSYTLIGLTNGTTYFFVLTSVNSAGESAASNQASATPTSGITVNLVPNTAASGTLQASATASLTFNFPANAVSQSAVATISPLTPADLPVPLARANMANANLVPHVTASDTYIAGFSLELNPSSIPSFNVPVSISGSIGGGVPANTTLNLATLQNGSYVDVATFVVGAAGGITENIPSVTLPGLLSPGTFILYQPAMGTSTAVSNLGLIVVADDGFGLQDGSGGGGLQVIHLYDANGNLLPTPTLTYLDYTNANDFDGVALAPDGSRGIIADGGNTVRLFSQLQTGSPFASITTVDISAYGGDGDSVAMLPTGDEAVVSGDDPTQLVVVSGILAGTPVAATTIPVPSNRDGVVVSNDGAVLLARGGTGLTVYSIAVIPPTAGSVGGTVSHSYTQVVDIPSLGTNYESEDGRNGMSISPADSSRAAVLSLNSATNTVNMQLMTGLTSTPVAGPALPLPAGIIPYSVSITPDGKNAIVGTATGLLLYTGVDTGALAQVGSAYAPAYTLGTTTVTLGQITTLGVTLDSKYVVAGDKTNGAVVVVPFTSAGFAGALASAIGGIAIPSDDQLIVH